LSRVPDGCLTPRRTSSLTVGRNITFTLTLNNDLGENILILVTGLQMRHFILNNKLEFYFNTVFKNGHSVAQSLSHYATSRMVAGPRVDEANEIFSTYVILPAALGPGVYSATNRNENQKLKIMFLVSRVRPARKAHKLTAICEPSVGSSTSHNYIGLHGLLRGHLLTKCVPKMVLGHSEVCV
jgi:hypothetical protein